MDYNNNDVLYRENIRNYLIHRANAVRVDTSGNLLNLSVLSEDFYCEFLNILLGLSLKNANERKQNAPGFDLIDKDKHVVVQVSATGEDKVSNKIKESLQKTNTLSNETWQFYYVPITVKADTSKAIFSTPDGLHFNPKTDILDINRILVLAQHSGIDKLKALSELVDKYKKKDSNPGGKRYITILVFAIALVVILCSIIAIRQITRPVGENNMKTGNSLQALVYSSDVLPYTTAGYYASYEDLPLDVSTEKSVGNAFSILSFVRNYGDRNAQIEEISCEILDLQPILEPHILFHAYIKNHVLELYVMNDGWGDAKGIDVACNISLSQSADNPLFQGIKQVFSTHSQLDIPGGEVLLAAEYALDVTEIRQWMEETGETRYYCELEFNLPKEQLNYYTWGKYSLQYDYETDSFRLFRYGTGGEGDSEKPSITLFAVLDVDRHPYPPFFITFTGEEAAPVVNDTFRIETVIAPTKSCRVMCKGVYSINGEKQETDLYTVIIRVPRFLTLYGDRYGLHEKVIDEVVTVGAKDPTQIAQICQKYQYNAETFILEEKKRYQSGE